MVCLASRSAYSEFRALVIDRDPILKTFRLDLYRLHQEAVRVLGSVSHSTLFVEEFRTAVEDRLNELQDSHISERVAAS